MCLPPCPSFVGLVYGTVAFFQRMTFKSPVCVGRKRRGMYKSDCCVLDGAVKDSWVNRCKVNLNFSIFSLFLSQLER